MITYQSSFAAEGSFQQNDFVGAVAAQLRQQGFCILPGGMPADLSALLYQQLQNEDTQHSFKRAGIGRKEDKILDSDVRRDSIRWIDHSNPAGKA